MSWMVKQDFPTPPEPMTTILYDFEPDIIVGDVVCFFSVLKNVPRSCLFLRFEHRCIRWITSECS